MSSGSGRAAMLARPLPVSPADVSFEMPKFWQHIGARHVVVLLFVLAYPLFASPFLTYQIGAQSLALGLIALSLTFLGGYGGMISLAQMTVAGIAGYGVAIFGAASGSDAAVSLGVAADLLDDGTLAVAPVSSDTLWILGRPPASSSAAESSFSSRL